MSFMAASHQTIDSININQGIAYDEEIVPQVGHFGKYQTVRYLLLTLISIPVCVQWLADIILSAEVPHCCAFPQMHRSPYREFFLNGSYPLLYPPTSLPLPEINLVQRIPDICSMYESRCYEENVTDFTAAGCGVQPCVDGHFFVVNEPAGITIVNQFGLVCEKSHLKRVSTIVFMLGVLVGAFGVSYLSDKYGRRATMFSVIGLQALFGFILAFMYSFVSFITMRFLIGTTTAGLYLVIFVLGCELVGPQWRTFVGLGYEITFGLGYLVLAALGYFIRDWKVFQMAISLPSLLLFFYWKAIPESPRWLMATGNMKKAAVIIRKMAKENGVVLNRDFQSRLDVVETAGCGGGGAGRRGGATGGSRASSHGGESSVTAGILTGESSVLDLLRFPKLRSRTCILCLVWLVLSLVYYSIVLMVGKFAGNLYINTCISGLVEIPATLISFPLITKIGRKLPLSIFLTLSSLSLMACALIPPDNQNLITGAAMICKFTITSGFAILYVYSAELYPTTLRNNGMGINSMFGRIGAICSPIALLLGELWWLTPLFAILSVLCLCAAGGTLFLPETKNKPLPETVNKIEGKVELLIPKTSKNVSFCSIRSNLSVGFYTEDNHSTAASCDRMPEISDPACSPNTASRRHPPPPLYRQGKKSPPSALYDISGSSDNSSSKSPVNRDDGGGNDDDDDAAVAKFDIVGELYRTHLVYVPAAEQAAPRLEGENRTPKLAIRKETTV